MPTDEIGKLIVDGDIFIQDKDGQINKIAEIQSFESMQENNNDAVDAMKYAVKGMTEREMSMTIDIKRQSVRRILKVYGLEKITRKRFKKLLMGCGMQRNEAEIVANAFKESEINYTPLAVQKVIETINEEAEKEENR
jgi:uncharacterized protein (DUF2344 family)